MRVGHDAAIQGIVIVSGGARGIDQSAVDACLKNGGKAIVFPSEGLGTWVKKKEVRQYIQNNQLLLISAQPISARFTGAYAMQRNKYIHTTSHAVLVASSKIRNDSKNTYSGTWSGVLENIKGGWTPLFVQGQSEGVKKLLEEGNASPFNSFTNLLALAQSKNTSVSSNVEQVVKSDRNKFPTKEIMQLLIEAKDNGLREDQVRQEIELLIKKIFVETKQINKKVIDNSIEFRDVSINSEVIDETTISPQQSDTKTIATQDKEKEIFEQINLENWLTQDIKDK